MTYFNTSSWSPGGRSFTRFYNTSEAITRQQATTTLVAAASTVVTISTRSQGTVGAAEPVGKSSDNDSSGPHHSTTIAGSVVGSVAGVALIVLTALYLAHRYYDKRGRNGKLLDSGDSDDEESPRSFYGSTCIEEYEPQQPVFRANNISGSIGPPGRSIFTETGSL